MESCNQAGQGRGQGVADAVAVVISGEHGAEAAQPREARQAAGEAPQATFRCRANGLPGLQTLSANREAGQGSVEMAEESSG